MEVTGVVKMETESALSIGMVKTVAHFAKLMKILVGITLVIPQMGRKFV